MGEDVRTLVGLLAERVRRAPEREALVGSSTRLTWREYEAGSARVAFLLRARGIVTGDRVAVALPKDVASFIAIHGVLRIGAVVVPIDPLAPSLVARTTMEDAGVSAVFADRRLLDGSGIVDALGERLRLVVTPGDQRTADSVCWADAMACPPDADAGTPQPDDPAYIIYTSGSTGRPKGIVHTHRSALAYAERAVEFHRITDRDRVAGMSPLHFDMSTLELYAAPLAGAAVVVFGEAHLRFPASFTQRCEAERTTVWYTVPSFLRQVVERGAMEQRDLTAVRTVMYGGEPYTADGLAALAGAMPGALIENVYGPAEVNECTTHLVDTSALDADVPIGRPWSGVELMIVDDDGRPVPPGEQGELLVSAPTLMAGYWNRPDLTERCLVPRVDGPAWYRTGDLVTVDADGVYWFAGRKDHQVKVRGIRIELEAVEAALNDAPDVVHAVAAAVGAPGSVTHLVGVVVLREGATLDGQAIRAHCRARLASVAVPHEIIERSELPLTATGKIDRRLVRSEFAVGDVATATGGGS